MGFFERGSVFAGMLLLMTFALGACSSGVDDQYAKVFSDLNPEWELYEVKEKGEGQIILVVDVQDVVSFKDGKKAVEELQKITPNLEGYIDFYNSEVGMTLRRMEIIPPTT